MSRIYPELRIRPPLEDLAILRCFGKYSFLPLSTVTPSERTDVHIIGYPGKTTKAWLKRRHGLELPDLESALKDAQALLPESTSTVSVGKITNIKDGDGCANYNVSTVPGISGGCLLSQGDVCGMPALLCCRFSDKQGVHLGHQTVLLRSGSGFP